MPQGGAEVFNSVPPVAGDREEQLGNLDFGVFRFTVETLWNPPPCWRPIFDRKR